MHDIAPSRPGLHRGASLPPPKRSGGLSLNQALAGRRSVRAWGPERVTEGQISQLLWAAQGVTGPGGERAAPSAGGLHPLAVHLLTAKGVERYTAGSHSLELLTSEDRRARLGAACLDQEFVGQAPAILVVASRRRIGRDRYGIRADRYAAIEAGHVAQNVLLEAVALGLAATPVGAFYDAEVRREAEFDERVDPLCVIPVGHPA